MEDERNPPNSETTERSAMARQRRSKRDSADVGSSIDFIGQDLLQNILSRLPASSIAYAACVSRSWNTLCNRAISRPKLSSAFSLNPSLQVAVEEVLDKVLSEPLRPHFAVACISPSFSLRLAHQLITKKLGSTTPVITCVSNGIIGRDALTNEFKEVQWGIIDVEGPDAQADNISLTVDRGISLTVGFFPGIKVDAIPLLQSVEDQDFNMPMVDQFVMDIREYTASVSGCTSPAGIMMFGGTMTDMKPVLEELDYATSPETFIVGDEICKFLHRRPSDSGSTTMSRKYATVGVALVFVRDMNKAHDIGDIEFHVSLATGLSPIGPIFKTVVVRERSVRSTWLTGRREELPDTLDGQSMLDDINEQMRDRVGCPVLYIGVRKRRKCSVGLEKVKWVTSLIFHEVTGGDEEYLFVHGGGIKTGDSFRFYHSDPSSALSSCTTVSENLRRFCQTEKGATAANGDKKAVFGGMIFTCCGRGKYFFGRQNVDSSPFLENFPGIPVAGTFCGGEIGRGSSSSYNQEVEDQSHDRDVRCCLHVFSSIYVLLSYTPPLPEY